jgi:hypothetical protein
MVIELFFMFENSNGQNLKKHTAICGLYYKNITIVKDASRVVMSDATIWCGTYERN